MSTVVYCETCKAQIKKREDLVTATYMFDVYPYHVDCYARDLKSAKTIFLDNQPLNGFSSNVLFFFIIFITALWLLFADSSVKWVAVISLFPIAYRAYSYYFYERHTEK